MPRRNCAAGTAGRPSRLKTRRAFFSAPQRGGFCSSWKEGERLRPITGRRVLLLLEEGENGCAPHFFFSRERKRNVPRPVQRKRALGAAFVTKAAPFSFVLYVLKTGSLVLCGLVSPFAPLPLTGAGGLAFMLKNLAFHWKTAASYGDRDTVWQG